MNTRQAVQTELQSVDKKQQNPGVSIGFINRCAKINLKINLKNNLKTAAISRKNDLEFGAFF